MLYLNKILEEADALAASDIHINPPWESSCDFIVLFRKNRLLLKELCYPACYWRSLCSYLQFHSGYAYDSSHLFQDNMMQHQNRFLRLAFSPGREPYITIRCAQQQLPTLVLSEDLKDCVATWKSRGGLLLIVGPVHSGKTTLYYHLLNQARKEGLSLSSWEDPIEQEQAGLNQLHLPYSRWRESAIASLRFDWDIVGIGEVRRPIDLEPLIFLSLSSIKTITTIHGADLCSIRSKIKTLPALAQQQFKEVCSSMIFCGSDKKVILEHDV